MAILTWDKDRYVEETNDRKVKDGDIVYVDDVSTELLRAAVLPIGVMGAGYQLPDWDSPRLFGIAENIRQALGFERTPEDLRATDDILKLYPNLVGLDLMHAYEFDRFVRMVPGTGWRLRIIVLAQLHHTARADSQEHHLIYVGSGTAPHRLLAPDDVINTLRPFVQNEFEPQLRLHGIIK